MHFRYLLPPSEAPLMPHRSKFKYPTIALKTPMTWSLSSLPSPTTHHECQASEHMPVICHFQYSHWWHCALITPMILEFPSLCVKPSSNASHKVFPSEASPMLPAGTQYSLHTSLAPSLTSGRKHFSVLHCIIVLPLYVNLSNSFQVPSSNALILFFSEYLQCFPSNILTRIVVQWPITN